LVNISETLGQNIHKIIWNKYFNILKIIVYVNVYIC